MHFSENVEFNVPPLAHSPFANTQLVEDGEPWDELSALLQPGPGKPALACGTERRFVRCAFCATILTVEIRASRKFALCKGMSHGWVPHPKNKHPARPVCDSPTCLQFAEFHESMEFGKLVRLVEFACGLGGYKALATKVVAVPTPKETKQRNQERRKRRKQRQREQGVW